MDKREQTRGQKISAALSGRTIPKKVRAKMSKSRRGKTHSEETKRKISMTLRGKSFVDTDI